MKDSEDMLCDFYYDKYKNCTYESANGAISHAINVSNLFN